MSKDNPINTLWNVYAVAWRDGLFQAFATQVWAHGVVEARQKGRVEFRAQGVKLSRQHDKDVWARDVAQHIPLKDGYRGGEDRDPRP